MCGWLTYLNDLRRCDKVALLFFEVINMEIDVIIPEKTHLPAVVDCVDRV